MSFAPAFTAPRPRLASAPNTSSYGTTRSVNAPRSFTASAPSYVHTNTNANANANAYTNTQPQRHANSGAHFGASMPFVLPAAVPAYSRFLPQSFFSASASSNGTSNTSSSTTTTSSSNNSANNSSGTSNCASNNPANCGSANHAAAQSIPANAGVTANSAGPAFSTGSPTLAHAHATVNAPQPSVPAVPRTHTANAALSLHKPALQNYFSGNQQNQEPKYTTKLGVLFPARSPDNPSELNQMIRHYRVIRSIGEGAFGKVKLALDTKTNTEVAVKTYAKSKLSSVDLSRIYKEMDALRKTDGNKNIIKMIDCFEERDNIYIILEFAKGGDLLDYLDSRSCLSEVEAKGFFYQVVKGLHHCHSHKIIHRDLKLENILLTEDQTAKISDFGLSNQPIGDCLKTICGTPVYRSPEMVSNQDYTFATDIWSLGVILYVMLHGRFPFYDENLSVLFKKIISGRFPPITNGGTEVQQLIHMMLHVNPKARITLEGILNHPWLRDLVSADPAPVSVKLFRARSSVYSESSYVKESPVAFNPVSKPRSTSDNIRYHPLTNHVNFSYGVAPREWNPVPATTYGQRLNYAPAFSYLPPR